MLPMLMELNSLPKVLQDPEFAWDKVPLKMMDVLVMLTAQIEPVSVHEID
jgi:hypothetical protein